MAFLILVAISLICLGIFAFGKVPENRKARLTIATGLAITLAGTLIAHYQVYTFAGKSIMIVGILVFATGIIMSTKKQEEVSCSAEEKKINKIKMNQ